MEARLAPSFSVRAGYNYTSAPFRKTAYKALDYNDMRTDVDYTNTFERNTVTVGLGYSGNVFFADLAYKYDMYKSEFYAFSADALQPVKTDNNRHQVLLTMGVRF
jgi:opacity protein-like surface antigen